MFIKVKVFPNSKEKKVIQKSKDSFDVKIKSKPIEGKANKETKTVLSNYFNITESKVRLIKGFKRRAKIFEIIEK